MTVALLDGDILVYRAAAALQRTVDWGDGEAHSYADVEEAAQVALQTADAWIALAGCQRGIVAFTGDDNFRKRLLPSYKSHRKGKPIAFAPAMAAVREHYEHHVIRGLEADDVMGILATTLPKYEGAVMVTIDKDLRTVPGLHLNPLKEKKPVVLTEAQADHLWLMQALTGDSTDGYAGIPGVGPKTAAKILGSPGRPAKMMWPAVVAAFVKAGLTEADALTMARVARILRREDYDKTSKEIKLWHPKKPESMALVDNISA